MIKQAILAELQRPITHQFYTEINDSGYHCLEFIAVINRYSNTYRRETIKEALESVAIHFESRNIFMAPYESVYPVGSVGSPVGKCIRSTRWIVIDLDCKEATARSDLNRLRECVLLQKEPRYTVSTGAGFQLWYRLSERVHEEAFRRIYSSLTKSIRFLNHDFQLDTSGGDHLKHVRAPGFVNQKYMDKPVARLVDFHDETVDVRHGFGHRYGKAIQIKKDILSRKEMKELRAQLRREQKKWEGKHKRTICHPVKEPLKAQKRKAARERFLGGVSATGIRYRRTIKKHIRDTFPGKEDRSAAKAAITIIKYSNRASTPLSCRMLVEACAARGITLSVKKASYLLRRLVDAGILTVNRNVNLGKREAYEYQLVYKDLVIVIAVKNSNGHSEITVLASCRLTSTGQTNYTLIKLARMARFNNLDPGDLFAEWLAQNREWMSADSLAGNLRGRFDKLYLGAAA